MNWYGAETSDPLGQTFFSQSLFRSGYFITAALLFITVLFYATWFLLRHRGTLPSEFLILLFISIIVRTIHSTSAAIARHKSLRQTYFSDRVRATAPYDERSNAALGVAARAIVDDVFNTSVTLLAFVFVISLLLRHPQ
jgi:hypothetical protein